MDTSWYVGHENESYYEITTAEQLAGMAYLSSNASGIQTGFKDKTIKLMNDLDLAGLEWTPISINGVNMSNSGAFEGILEGGGHVIRNLKATGEARNGLFSAVNGGTVRNLGIEDAEIVQGGSYFYQGILCAFAANNFRFINCYTTGSVRTTEDMANSGGLVGYAAGGGQIVGCYSEADMRSEKEVDPDGSVNAGIGGIAGAWHNSHLSKSWMP